jgi:type IV secretory pathway VirD2 relaxase
MHYVMRTHSHTDRQQLWKVMSRGFPTRLQAETWMNWCEVNEKNKDHKFFIVFKEEEEDNG